MIIIIIIIIVMMMMMVMMIIILISFLQYFPRKLLTAEKLSIWDNFKEFITTIWAFKVPTYFINFPFYYSYYGAVLYC